MKNLALIVSLAAVSLGFSSCCSMFGRKGYTASYRTETRQVKTCHYDIVTEEVVTPGDAKSGKGGMVQTIEKKVPRLLRKIFHEFAGLQGSHSQYATLRSGEKRYIRYLLQKPERGL